MTQTISLLLVLILTTSFTAQGQTGTIKGQVYDRYDKQGLEMAKLLLTDKAGNTYTSFTGLKGNYRIEKIAAGIYSLTVSYISYGDTTITKIKIASDTTLTINLQLPPACKYDAGKNNKTCPRCHKRDKVIPIVYGLIISTKGEDPMKNAGKTFIPGGCGITYCQPYWYCKRDRLKF